MLVVTRQHELRAAQVLAQVCPKWLLLETPLNSTANKTGIYSTSFQTFPEMSQWDPEKQAEMNVFPARLCTVQPKEISLMQSRKGCFYNMFSDVHVVNIFQNMGSPQPSFPAGGSPLQCNTAGSTGRRLRIDQFLENSPLLNRASYSP